MGDWTADAVALVEGLGWVAPKVVKGIVVIRDKSGTWEFDNLLTLVRWVNLRLADGPICTAERGECENGDNWY